MFQSTLPLELCDEIIDFCSDDVETLAACSLVSHSWVNRSQKHLFRRIYIPSKHTPNFGRQRLRSLKVSELEEYVELKVFLQASMQFRTHIQVLVVGGRFQFEMDLTDLEPILTHLPALRGLVFKEIKLDPQVVFTPRSFAQTISLKVLRLIGVCLPGFTFHNLLSMFASISTLHVDRVLFYKIPRTFPNPSQQVPICSVEMFGANSKSDTICLLLTPYASSITSIYFESRSYPGISIPQVQNAFEAFGKRITSLHLDNLRSGISHRHLLPFCSVLQHLHLRVNHVLEYPDGNEEWPMMLACISSVPRFCPAIRNITIQIGTFTRFFKTLVPTEPDTFESLTRGLDWAGFRIARRGYSPGVAVVILPPFPSQEVSKENEDELSAMLRAGALVFSDDCGWEPCQNLSTSPV